MCATCWLDSQQLPVDFTVAAVLSEHVVSSVVRLTSATSGAACFTVHLSALSHMGVCVCVFLFSGTPKFCGFPFWLPFKATPRLPEKLTDPRESRGFAAVAGGSCCAGRLGAALAPAPQGHGPPNCRWARAK